MSRSAGVILDGVNAAAGADGRRDRPARPRRTRRRSQGGPGARRRAVLPAPRPPVHLLVVAGGLAGLAAAS